jgi:hypothetical protein
VEKNSKLDGLKARNFVAKPVGESGGLQEEEIPDGKVEFQNLVIRSSHLNFTRNGGKRFFNGIIGLAKNVSTKEMTLRLII